MIKITIEVDTQEEFDLAYQAVMPAIGEVCDGVGMRTLVGVVKGVKRSWENEGNALMDWLNTRSEWMVVDERPHPLTPSPAERGDLDEVVKVLESAFWGDISEDEKEKKMFGIIQKKLLVEDVSLEMMQDDTTPIVQQTTVKDWLELKEIAERGYKKSKCRC